MWARSLTTLALITGCAGGPGAARAQPNGAQPSPARAGAARPGAPDRERTRFVCSRPTDCGPGNACCTTPLWDGSYCATRCDLANNGQVCLVDADCPELGGKSTRCAPVPREDAPSMPASLKVCQ